MNEIRSQITHVTACKSAGRQDGDGISLILKRNSTEVRLGQTDQLLMVHTCGGAKNRGMFFVKRGKFVGKPMCILKRCLAEDNPPPAAASTMRGAL